MLVRTWIALPISMFSDEVVAFVELMVKVGFESEFARGLACHEVERNDVNVSDFT
jgi:hypothetical protein